MKVIGRTILACGTIRYHLDNGWFADKASVKAHQHFGYAVSVWEPGAGELVEWADTPYRIAAFRGGGKSLKVALATLGKMEGRRTPSFPENLETVAINSNRDMLGDDADDLHILGIDDIGAK